MLSSTGWKSIDDLDEERPEEIAAKGLWATKSSAQPRPKRAKTHRSSKPSELTTSSTDALEDKAVEEEEEMKVKEEEDDRMLTTSSVEARGEKSPRARLDDMLAKYDATQATTATSSSVVVATSPSDSGDQLAWTSQVASMDAASLEDVSWRQSTSNSTFATEMEASFGSIQSMESMDENEVSLHETCLRTFPAVDVTGEGVVMN